MKKFYQNIFLLFLSAWSFETIAQPTVAYFSGAATVRQDLTVRGGARFARFQANATGVRQYAFHIGTSGAPNYGNNWRPFTAGDAAGAIAFNQSIDPAGNVNSARYNGGGGTDGNTPSVTSGQYYTLNVGNNAATANNTMSILQTNYNPQSITGVTVTGTSTYLYENKQVDITLAAVKNGSEQLIIRWSTDGFATSNFTTANTLVSGSTYRGNISVTPALYGTGTVQFYVFSSVTTATGGGANQLNHLTADFLTLNMRNSVGENQSGANFSYSVINEVASAAVTGNWSVGSSWLGGTVPPANSTVRILSGSTITLNTDVTLSRLNINSGGIFVASDATARIITLTRGATDACGTGTVTFDNQGTFTRVNSTVVFNATGAFSPVHQVTGTVGFHNVSVTNATSGQTTGVNFGSASTINNTFTINVRGYVCTNGPFYATNSLLQYNMGVAGAFICGAEWYANATSGQGIPYNVQLDANNTDVSFGTSTAYRYAANNFTLNSGNPSTFSLSSVSGGDLKLGGNFNYTNSNATFNTNNRALFMIGTGDQTINTVPSPITLNYLVVDKPTGKLTFTGIGGQVSVVGALGGNAIQILNFPTQITLGTNKILSIHGTINWFAGSAFEGSATSSITLGNNAGTAPGQVDLRFASGFENLNNLILTRGATGAGGVNLTSNLTLAGLLTLNEGTIQFGTGTARTLTLNGGITINTGTNRIIDMSGGNLAHSLVINGTNTVTNVLTSFLAGTGGATGSIVTYGASANQNVFGSVTYNRLAFSGSGIKTLQNGSITAHSISLSGSAHFSQNNSNWSVTGNATGTFSMASGTTYTINTGSGTIPAFPSNFIRANINLDPASTFRWIHNDGPTISTEPIYGNLVVEFNNGGGNKTTRCATGPGAFTTLRIAGSFDYTRTVSGGGNEIFDLTLNGGFNLDIDGNLQSTGLLGGSQLTINFTSQNINIGGNSNGWGTTAVGTLTGTQTGAFTYDGSSAQTIRGMVYNNVTFSGGGLKTLAAGLTGGAFRVNGTATLSANNIVDLAAVNFELGTAAALSGTFSNTTMFRTSGAGSFRRYRDAAFGSFVFPLGTTTFYNPATVNIVAATYGGVAGSRFIGVRVNGAADPALVSNDPNTLSCYWDISAANITAVTNGTLSFTYEDGQVTTTDASFAGGYNVNGAGSFQNNLTAVNTATNVISFTSANVSTWNSGNLTGFWLAAAGANIPGAIVPFFTRQDGPWSDPNTWSIVAFGGAAAPIAPTNTGSVIRIGNGNTVTLDVNTVTSIADLQIQSTGVFDIGVESFTGSSFSGAGTLRLRAASGTRTFPTFTTNSFLTTSGSVVEYNGNTSYNLPTTPGTYQSVIISGGGTKTLTGNLLAVENLSVNTSGTTLELATFTFNRTAVGGTFNASIGTTVRTAFVAGGGGQNAFPDNFSTYTMAGSTAEFYGTTNQQTINPINYHNLTLSGNRGGNNIRFDNNPTGVSGVFDVSGLGTNYGTVWGGGSGRINFNGTTAQSVPGFRYQRIEVSGNKGGATVTFDPTNTVFVRDQLIFTSAVNTNYSFANNTISYYGASGSSGYTISNNPTGFPFNNIIAGGLTFTPATVGSNLNINGNLTISLPLGVNLGTGNLTMGTGSSVLVSSILSDNNVLGTTTWNNANITIGPTGLIDLSQSAADLGTTSGTLTFDGGSIGGVNIGIASLTVSNMAFTGDGTIGRGNVTVTNAFTLPATRTLNFTSTAGTKTFNGNVNINGNWNNTGNQAITYQADLNVNTGSTFTVGTGTQIFDGTSNIAGSIASIYTLPNISVTTGSTATNQRTVGLNVNSFGAGTGTFVQGANSILNYGSASAITPTLNASAAGNTINYTVAASSVKTATYHNLDLQGGGVNTLGGDVNVNGNLELNGTSIARTNANTLALNAGATLTGAGSSAFVWGNLQKNVQTGSPTVAFEIGNNTIYAPISLAFTGVSVAGDVSSSTLVNIFATPGFILLNKGISANRYWTLTNVNTLAFTSYTGTFNFDASDYFGGAINSDLRGAIHDGSIWNYPGTTGLVGNAATLNTVNYFGTVILASCINPVAYTLSGTGSGAYCAGGSGSTLTLSNSQIGASYQLQLGGVDTGSPISGTGAALNFGDFTVNGAYTVIATTGLTGCFATMNGTVNVVTNPLPTLSGVSQSATVCSGFNATINLAGLLPSSTLSVSYAINGVNQTPVVVNSNGAGAGSIILPVTFANNGQLLEVTSITNTSLVPNCTEAFVSSNSVTLAVFPRPTVDISANEFVCLNQTAPIDFFFTGTGPWTLDYKINGVSQAQVISPISPYSNPYTLASVARTYAVVSLSDANCTAVLSGLDTHFIDVPIPCQITWNGSQSTSWVDKDNWTPNNSAPSPNTSVIIPGGVPNQPNLVANATCAGVSLTGSANPQIGPGTQLSIRGDLNGTGFAILGGSGKVAFTGTGLQTVTGNPRITNVDFANTSGNGVVIAPGGKLQIEPNGVVMFLANSKVTNNGNFVLSSSVSGTAKIGIVPPSSIFIGEITQERYIPFKAGATGAWYFMGSPFSGKNFTNWSDNFFVTGLTSGFGSQGGSIISSSEPERSTILKYVEANHNQRIDTAQKIGWTIPGAAENIVPGMGYRAYINYYSAGNQKFDNKGSLTSGNFTFPTLTRNEYGSCIPATYACSSTWRGWNLLANPYPCDVDWDAVGGWNKPTEMSNAWYRWNALGSGYGVYTNGIGYIGASPAPSNPNIIPSGQAFFVLLGASGVYNRTLSINETAKSLSPSGSFQRTATVDQKIKIYLTKVTDAGTYGYSSLVRFKEDATDNFDFAYDFTSLGGARYSISVLVESGNLSVSTYGPLVESKSVPLGINYMGEYGEYKLQFTEFETLMETMEVYLKDNMLGTIQQITPGYEYNYIASQGDGILGERFELVFSPMSVTQVSKKVNQEMELYPNPSLGGQFNINLKNIKDTRVQIIITDILGKEVFRKPITISGGSYSGSVKTDLPAGIYNVEVQTFQSRSKKTIVIR